MPTERFANYAATTLNGSLTNSATSVVVTSATGFPTAGQFRVLVESELMLVTAVSGSTFTVVRGIENTSAVSHASGIAVAHIMTAGAQREWQPSWNLLPRHIGLLSFNVDPAMAFTQTAATSGVVMWYKLFVPQACTVTGIMGEVQVAGATLTAGQNKVGLYTVAGTTATKQAESADQATAWTSTGTKSMALGSTVGLDPAGDPDYFVYVAILSVGTTTVSWKSASTRPSVNGLLTSSQGFRSATGASAQTALPTTYALTSMTVTGNLPWLALY